METLSKYIQQSFTKQWRLEESMTKSLMDLMEEVAWEETNFTGLETGKILEEIGLMKI